MSIDVWRFGMPFIRRDTSYEIDAPRNNRLKSSRRGLLATRLQHDRIILQIACSEIKCQDAVLLSGNKLEFVRAGAHGPNITNNAILTISPAGKQQIMVGSDHTGQIAISISGDRLKAPSKCIGSVLY
jgi:hypothetical protein